jgi:hypothetical protein
MKAWGKLWFHQWSVNLHWGLYFGGACVRVQLGLTLYVWGFALILWREMENAHYHRLPPSPDITRWAGHVASTRETNILLASSSKWMCLQHRDQLHPQPEFTDDIISIEYTGIMSPGSEGHIWAQRGGGGVVGDWRNCIMKKIMCSAPAITVAYPSEGIYWPIGECSTPPPPSMTLRSSLVPNSPTPKDDLKRFFRQLH